MEISVTAITNLHQIHFTALENNGGLRFPPPTAPHKHAEEDDKAD
jgi:hypothetical protein